MITFTLCPSDTQIPVFLSVLLKSPVISTKAAGQRWLSHQLPHKILTLGSRSCQQGKGVSMSNNSTSPSGAFKNRQQAKSGWRGEWRGRAGSRYTVCQLLIYNMERNLQRKGKLEDLHSLTSRLTSRRYATGIKGNEWMNETEQRALKHTRTYMVISYLTKVPK